MRPYPPLNTLHAAAVLRNDGLDVAVFDSMLAEDESEFAASLAEHRPTVVVLYEDNFNFLSKMCLTRMREAALTMVGMALGAGCKVAVSGADVTDHPEVYLAAGAHACMVGEGEHTMREVVARWLGPEPDSSLDDVEGLAIRVGDQVARTPKRSIERHPDVFGAPARDLVDIEAYRQAWTEAHGRFSLNVVSTRGCPYHCNWCAKPIWGQRYSMRSAAEVADEFVMLHRDHRPDHVWFADDIFGLRSDWLAEFARLVDEASELCQPVAAEAEDVVGEPHVVGSVVAVQHDELVGHLGRRPHRVALPPDGLGAPVAVVRATAGRHHVEREPAVGLGPRLAVGLDVDQVAGRRTEHIGVALDRALRRAGDLVADPDGQALHIVEARVGFGAEPPRHHLTHRVLAFAHHARMGAGGEVHLGVVGDIGSAHGDLAAGSERHAHHGERCLAHAREAHLRQEVEVVLVQDHHRRPMLGQAGSELRLVLGQHRVEDGDVEPVVAQHRRSVQRVQRRVRAHLRVLLRIEPQEVRVRKENGLTSDSKVLLNRTRLSAPKRS